LKEERRCKFPPRNLIAQIVLVFLYPDPPQHARKIRVGHVVALQFGLEGIVSKRRTAPYLSGTRSGWVKVKCSTWRVANKDRGELFRRKAIA
jgi:hypothetical protein